ncbi:ABC transporter ATP-binding protein [Bosea sp. (in: a-proteobacteria)]|uniref:ABC transporter ATP-binding protein n=1 Tax=Bosea sp. (in: a-proteobacteria) TaxID=1871050 RepID=UPI002736DBF0|nr:ABC transporter ATP-binding protein [Bosea sp. (in: a-proteobacteria)]MDP3256195.1 ABC transporter ATP-binding protein [Bosea sp. (in: a-proteobacteria)]
MMRVACQGLGASAGDTVLLDDVGLSFAAPALIGILGPNGAGKSTLLRLLAGYRKPERGVVSWDGRPLSHWTATERGAACGYCPQQFEPAWNYAVAEIVGLGRDRSPAKAAPLETILEENGLAALAARRWSQLSGGERARTMLAATLATQPPFVLADEPGASLDMRHRLALLERLEAYATSALVIVVMHDLDLALRFCDRLVLLDHGRVAADRAADAMLDDPAFAAAFGLRLQAEPRRPDRDWVIGLG